MNSIIDSFKVLSYLSFGDVDSESENDLNMKFIRTMDFDEFLNEKNVLTLGAKGSGKSALFDMFTKYEDTARKLSNGRLTDIIIVRGTGFKDLKELTTPDMESLMQQDGFDFEKVWQLYIAIKVALQLGQKGYCSGENLVDFLKASGEIDDFRILPLLKGLWKLIVGPYPKVINLKIKGLELSIGNNSKEIDVHDLLKEINDLLVQEDKYIWILFDKIDELFSKNPGRRKSSLEGLFLTYLSLSSKYPRIKFKIFLRTDLWSTLSFVNKSHLLGKTHIINWDTAQLLELMVRRACIDPIVKDYMVDTLSETEETLLSAKTYATIFYSIFDTKVYKGKKEAAILDWMVQRVTDGNGGMYPREMITFGNFSQDIQKRLGTAGSTSLITGSSVKEAYFRVSEARCDTYLSEFPQLKMHFDKFQGKGKAVFRRA